MKAAPQSHLKPGEKFIGRIDTPHGVHLIKKGGALDHARMRATQLTSLLLLIQGESDMETFKTLRIDMQDSLIWLALQTSEDLGATVELIAEDANEEAPRPSVAGDITSIPAPPGGDSLAPDQRQLLSHYAKLSDATRNLVVDLAQSFTENPENLRPASDRASLVPGGAS